MENLDMVQFDRSGLISSPFAGIIEDDLPDDLLPGADFALDQHQRTAVVALLEHGIGCIRATVSAGKTAICLSTAALIKRKHPKARILYIVPTERLAAQVYGEVKKLLPSWNVSQLGGGKKDQTGTDIVVAIDASLRKHLKRLSLSGWFNTFMCVMVDECHHAAAKGYQNILAEIPAFYRFGLSDSLKNEREKDIAAMIAIRGLLGPERSSISSGPLIEMGRIATPYIYVVEVPEWRGKFDHLSNQAAIGSPAWALINSEWKKGTYVGPATGSTEDPDDEEQAIGWQVLEIEGQQVEVASRWCLLDRAYDRGIIRFRERNDMIVRFAMDHHRRGLSPQLVVATRTTHVHILHAMLEKAGLPVQMLTGESSPKDRDETFHWLKTKPGAVLVGSIMREGVSIPELRAGIVADAIIGPDSARQVIGRMMRKKTSGDNHAHVVLFHDLQVKSLRSGGRRLLEELETLRGYRFCKCSSPEHLGLWYEPANLN
jgi:superfamily II DNA or RNA helicase